MSRRLLVLGAAGFLGSNVTLQALRDPDIDVWSHSRFGRASIRGVTPIGGDLMQDGVVESLLESVEPDVVVNCAALASIDRCESDPEMADRVNAWLPGRIAVVTSRMGCSLVHVSTDAVFGGLPGPFTPNSPPAPVNVYGRTKLAGEIAVLDAHDDALVLRTNIFGWSPTGRSSLLEFFHRSLEAGRAVSGFVDVSFRPVAAHRFWDAVGFLVEQSATGVHHLVGTTHLSKFDFGRHVAETFGFNPDLVRAASVSDGALEAPRGADLDLEPDPLLVSGRPDLLDFFSALAVLRDHAEDRLELGTLVEVGHGRI